MAVLIANDRSVGDDFKKAKVVGRKKQHSDLDLNLTPHPIRKDIVSLKDDVAIKNAVNFQKYIKMSMIEYQFPKRSLNDRHIHGCLKSFN